MSEVVILQKYVHIQMVHGISLFQKQVNVRVLK